jgi:hypothetical protein
LNELKGNTKKHMNEMKQTVQGMIEEIHTDRETLKNNQTEINNSIYQINITIEDWQTQCSKLKIEYKEQKTE